jgi:hypothetical protein
VGRRDDAFGEVEHSLYLEFVLAGSGVADMVVEHNEVVESQIHHEHLILVMTSNHFRR